MSSLARDGARLRRQLLARPEFSAHPKCPACGRETKPKAFAKTGMCRECDSERSVAFGPVRVHEEDIEPFHEAVRDAYQGLS